MCIPGAVFGSTVYEWFGPRKTLLVLNPILSSAFMAMTLANWSAAQEAGMAEILLMAFRVIQVNKSKENITEPSQYCV